MSRDWRKLKDLSDLPVYTQVFVVGLSGYTRNYVVPENGEWHCETAFVDEDGILRNDQGDRYTDSYPFPTHWAPAEK